MKKGWVWYAIVSAAFEGRKVSIDMILIISNDLEYDLNCFIKIQWRKFAITEQKKQKDIACLGCRMAKNGGNSVFLWAAIFELFYATSVSFSWESLSDSKG